MPSRITKLGQFACCVLLASLPAAAQLRPETTQPPEKKPAAKPARIVVETLPYAEVYLDDERLGQTSQGGRLVIGNVKPGEHTLRVALGGKKDYEARVTVVAGKDSTVKAALAEPEQPAAPSQPAPRVETPRRSSGAPTPGAVRQNSKDGLKYVWIPPGTLTMGCSPGDSECHDDEKPAHQVTITKGFWMGQTEVTVGAYKRFAAATGQQMPPAANFNTNWVNENMPIVNVTWNESQAYCQWAGGRLPTEAEWEYAARGGSTEARYGNLDEVAWYDKNSGGRTHDVAEKRANGFGLYDTLGNVWEWVNDWYDGKYYQNSPTQDPAGPTGGQTRVLRGGSWNSLPRVVRVSNRVDVGPASRNYYSGLRCVGEANIP